MQEVTIIALLTEQVITVVATIVDVIIAARLQGSSIFHQPPKMSQFIKSRIIGDEQYFFGPVSFSKVYVRVIDVFTFMPSI